MTDNVHYTIFRNGSRTYFHTSLFFPPDIRQDVFALYAFVRTADDVRALRETMVLRDGKDIPIMAKIEKPQAVDNIDAIIAEADGVMVARGDLGVELLPEEVPALQKMIVSKCNAAGKPVVIATQMLESMMRRSRFWIEI